MLNFIVSLFAIVSFIVCTLVSFDLNNQVVNFYINNGYDNILLISKIFINFSAMILIIVLLVMRRI